ncbi:MAG: hypothetical protein KGL35_25920 [Bradyrhizobium sp.]|nr:hypothetical protein [Bradyrhizobium sp.]HQT76829.1 hypothetical protein [Rhodopila sp.]
MKLVPNWRRALHWHSTQMHILGIVLSALATGLSMAYGSADSVQHAMLPGWVAPVVLGLVFVAAFVGRILKQDED